MRALLLFARPSVTSFLLHKRKFDTFTGSVLACISMDSTGAPFNFTRSAIILTHIFFSRRDEFLISSCFPLMYALCCSHIIVCLNSASKNWKNSFTICALSRIKSLLAKGLRMCLRLELPCKSTPLSAIQHFRYLSGQQAIVFLDYLSE